MTGQALIDTDSVRGRVDARRFAHPLTESGKLDKTLYARLTVHALIDKVLRDESTIHVLFNQRLRDIETSIAGLTDHALIVVWYVPSNPRPPCPHHVYKLIVQKLAKAKKIDSPPFSQALLATIRIP